MRVKILESYKHWKPVTHSVIKDDALADQIHVHGYAVIPFLDSTQLQLISEFYEQEHALESCELPALKEKNAWQKLKAVFKSH